MKNFQNVQKVRYLRKKQLQSGHDQQQQQQQQQFTQNIPSALQNYSRKLTTKNIQDQIQYFGSIIEPFNMKQQQNMGQIDQQGYFLFKRTNQYNDAWLDSINQGNQQMIADKIKKIVGEKGGYYKNVYQIESRIKQGNNQPIQENQQENQNQNDNNQEQEQQAIGYRSQSQCEQQQLPQQQFVLTTFNIRKQIIQFLPNNKSANVYVKQLKQRMKKYKSSPKQYKQTKQIHDKILQLCQLYIDKTTQYDILTKKQQLQSDYLDQLQKENNKEKQQELNWDKDSEQNQNEKGNINNNKTNNLQNNFDNDDIF